MKIYMYGIVAGVASVGCIAASASAQFNLVTQERVISLRADYANAIGYTESPDYDSAAPGAGTWSDSGSVLTGSSTFPYSAASGSQSSDIGPSSIRGTAGVNAYATQTLVTDSRWSSALSRIRIRFSVSAATHVVFDGSIDSATYDIWGRGPEHPVTMKITNITTGVVLGEVQTGYLHGPLWEIGAPIHLETTFTPGIYEILGEANQSGFGERPIHGGWSGVGSLSFNLQAVPAPGTALGLAALGVPALRRRRAV